MRQIYPDLWQSKAEHPFFGVNSHAYLLTKPAGNILFYSSFLRGEREEVKSLGGIAFQYLSHRDEVSSALAEIKREFGSKLACHRREEPSVRGAAQVDYLFDKREVLQETIEVIPTPGHTDGSVSFLVRSVEGKKYLFTGDTIYMNDGRWETRLQGGSKADLVDSLRLLRELAPDVVLSSASEGLLAYQSFTDNQWQTEVDRVLARL
jgi:glyoxylase-like metal-dependent hydrolase (beta-lactamase superfamily II)